MSITNNQVDYFQDVVDFHRKFEVPVASLPVLLEGEALAFRVKFLQEELDEFAKAHDEGNLEDALDALLDLIYVACGSADFMGISKECFNEAWQDVQRANMSKVRCNDASESKRGTSLDIRKPIDWQGPNHTPTLAKYSLTE